MKTFASPILVAALLFAFIATARTEDTRGREVTAQKKTQVVERDAKEGPSPRLRVQRRRASQLDEQLFYAARSPRIKLPWAPFAPGD